MSPIDSKSLNALSAAGVAVSFSGRVHLKSRWEEAPRRALLLWYLCGLIFVSPLPG